MSQEISHPPEQKDISRNAEPQGSQQDTNSPPQIENVEKVFQEAKSAEISALQAQKESEEVAKRSYLAKTRAQEKFQLAAQQIDPSSSSANLSGLKNAEESESKNSVHVEGSKDAHDLPNKFDAQGMMLQQNETNQEGKFPKPLDSNVGVVAQQILMSTANRVALNTTQLMNSAQQAISQSADPAVHQIANQQAELAQGQMNMAQQMAMAAQNPETAQLEINRIQNQSQNQSQNQMQNQTFSGPTPPAPMHLG